MVILLLERVERAGREDVGGLGRAARDRPRAASRSASKPGRSTRRFWSAARLSVDFDRDAVGRVQVNASLPAIVSEPAALVFRKVSFKQLAGHSRGCGGTAPPPRGSTVWIRRDALAQLGVGPAHHLGDDGHDLVQERLAPAHLVGVEHGPAEQAADDVALLLGPGPDVLVDAERQGPGMVGHPADADAVGLVALVLDARACSATAATIGLKMSVSKTDRDALQAGRRAFQAHAGVDVLLGQRLELARADAVELGEDEVPDLDFLRARRRGRRSPSRGRRRRWGRASGRRRARSCRPRPSG